jgi:DnaJ-class molecular chaperone
MAKDYYKILGVDKKANEADIKKAFRTLAHKYHPDKKGGDDAKFKEVNEAYQVLSNPQKRAQYDQFGSAGPGAGFGGQGGFQGGFGGFNWEDIMRQAQQQGGGFGGGQQFDFEDLGDIFSAFGFGGGPRTPRGRNIAVSVKLSFKESVYGCEKKISIPDIKDGKDLNKNKDITVSIPAGVEHGQTLRIDGYGEQMTNGNPGKLLITVYVEPHKTLRRDGNNLVMNLEVKLTDALLGADYTVESLDGKEKVKIPSGLQSGDILKIKGKGVKGGMWSTGDLLVVTSVTIPKKLSKKAQSAIEILQKEGL